MQTSRKKKAKRKKAKGGCLGARSRRRTQPAAKSRGETLAVSEPRVSEWGNPAGESPATAWRIHNHAGGNAAN